MRDSTCNISSNERGAGYTLMRTQAEQQGSRQQQQADPAARSPALINLTPARHRLSVH